MAGPAACPAQSRLTHGNCRTAPSKGACIGPGSAQLLLFSRPPALILIAAPFSSRLSRYNHRYHIVWITKYRYKVLQGKLRERVRDIIRQVCREMGVQIIEGVLSSDHIHMFVSVPPHVAISDLMQRAKGRSSYKIQMEFPEIRKRYWGRRF